VRTFLLLDKIASREGRGPLDPGVGCKVVNGPTPAAFRLPPAKGFRSEFLTCITPGQAVCALLKRI